ncbi:SDR family NAD(P)-dependent oxidoreductase [Sphingomonas sp. 37zxx]|uniref:SDR family NAD(P)-dependent oxidoreductase n=1 Tax=Sphingomonas sp. 37zxx TaxID=1550073 RepID=UPI00053BF323|nr:SDR family NAD(P)-dependent oxidoreductase [Sphingomonas sp. 37zxx]
MSQQEFAIVTGAGSGIGRELTRLFLQDGATVLAVSLVAEELTALEAEMAGTGGTLITRTQDLSELDAAETLLAHCDAQGWTVDTLVNNAGFATFGDVVDTDLARIQTMLQLNVLTVAKLSAVFGARMKARGAGNILNVGSTAGMVPSPRFAAYGASKAFVNAFSYAFREELRPHGVNVTCLTPGPVQTKFASTAEVDTFEGKSMIKQWFATGHVATAADVAREGYDGMRGGKAQVLAGTGSGLAALVMHLLPASLIPRLVKNA